MIPDLIIFGALTFVVLVKISSPNLMGESGIAKSGLDVEKTNKTGFPNLFDPTVLPKLLVCINQKFQDHRKAEFDRLGKVRKEINSIKSFSARENESTNYVDRDQEKQLQVWRDNPSWIDEPPVVKVTTQKGSFCRLNVEVNVGLPPGAVYDIFTHPENKRYFRNIKENVSRRVLIDEGSRQVVEVEQAAAWKFLWWSGTFPIHLLVDQNRKDFSSKYKQGKTRFMKVFEGCWRVEPLFVDEHLCEPLRPKTREEYCCCSAGKGRIGSKVIMDQMFQPAALLTPPPISWYVRGITVKTTETMIEDLLAEAARIRGGISESEKSMAHDDNERLKVTCDDIKRRWKSRGKKGKK